MLRRPTRLLGITLVGALAGCTSTGTSDEGTTLGNLLMYGGTSRPPVAATPVDEILDCPPVTVTDGGAAYKVGGGQIAISEVARECTGRPDGAIVVKVGVQGRALLGQGSGASRFDSPLTIALKRGDQVLASRARRVAVAIPSGQVDGTFVVVEDNLVVPPGTGEFDIEVGFGSGSSAIAKPARRRRGG